MRFPAHALPRAKRGEGLGAAPLGLGERFLRPPLLVVILSNARYLLSPPQKADTSLR
jgi:hypothetical protein